MSGTRYATTRDGLSIAYQVLGTGPPDLVWIPGFASHVELFWDLPGFAHSYRRLASFARLVLFDKRGTGLSDRSLGTGSPEERMLDIGAVMDAAGLSSAALLGTSEGAAMTAMFAAVHPDRVEKLIFMGADVTGSWVRPELPEIVEARWGTGQLLLDLWLHGVGERDALAHIERAMGSPRAMAAMMRHNVDLDARPALDGITVPSLVLHCVDDPVVPVQAGRAIAARLADSRFVPIQGDFHGSNLPSEMNRYLDQIERFLVGDQARAVPLTDRVLATVLITDIVGSTARAAELGDAEWSTLLDEHDRIVRGAVGRFGGRWIKSTGDGALATFDGPARAIAAAQATMRNLGPFDLRIRAGIHTGEIEQRGEDIGGIGVHIAARIAALAPDGGILVSPTVPGLVVGSGIHFDDWDDVELKGVPGSWRLARVDDTGGPTPAS